MTLTVQVLYPAGDGITFDHDYFVNSHMKLVARKWGAHIESTSVARGVPLSPDTPSAWSAIATMNVRDKAALEAMLGDSDEVNADVPNYTNATPQVFVGEIIA